MNTSTLGTTTLIEALQASWSADTAFDASDWTVSNPARGQCLVSSLVVQQYLGGELTTFTVEGEGIDESHHCNILPDGTLLDTTLSQYDGQDIIQTQKEPNTKGYASLRERYLADDYDRSRHERLLLRVERYMQTPTE